MANSIRANKNSEGRLILFLLILAAITAALQASAATYYVDSDGGNNSNDGQSPATAWKSVSKVNSTALAPGDWVLFQRGDVFSGQIMVNHSGTAGNPITYGTYGSGARPVITGADNLTAPTYRWNRSYWGISEYYLTLADGSNPNVAQPPRLWRNGVAMANGVIGSATNQSWGYGDIDNLGFNTIYIRDNAGNPANSGVKYERAYWRFNVYIPSGSYVQFENLVLDKGYDYAMRNISASSDFLFSNCTFRDSNGPIVRLFDAANFRFRNCSFEKSLLFQPLVLLTGINNTSSAVFDYCVFDDSSTYSVELANGTASDFTNCLFIGASTGFIYNRSSILANATNCIFTVPSKSSLSTQPFRNTGSGQINTIHSSILPNGVNPKAINLAGINQTNNLNKAAKFQSHRNRGIISFVIDDNNNLARWKAISDLAEPYGYRIGFALFTKDMTNQGWADVNTYVARGHEVISHSKSHAYLNSQHSFTVQYIGNAASAVIGFASPYLTTTLTGQSDGTANLSINTNLPQYDTFQEIANFINSQPGYQSSLTSPWHSRVAGTCLQDIQNINIKNTVHQLVIDKNRLLLDEVFNAKREIEQRIPGYSCDAFAYPGGDFDAQIIQYLRNCGHTIARTTIPNENTSMSDIRLLQTGGTNIISVIDMNNIERDIHALCETANYTGSIRIMYDHADVPVAKYGEIFAALAAYGDIQVMTMKQAASFVRNSGRDLDGDGLHWSVNSTYTANYRLKNGSPMIDMGTLTNLAYDFFNDSVPYNNVPDIGIYEWPGVGYIPPTPTPTNTPTFTSTATATHTPLPTDTPTTTPTSAATPIPTSTPTSVVTSTPTSTPTPVTTPTQTPSPEPTPLTVSVDVKPGECPNIFNTSASSQVIIAINGTASFDVTQIDPATVNILGIYPQSYSYADVSTPYIIPIDGCEDCHTAGADGQTDLVVVFSSSQFTAMAQSGHSLDVLGPNCLLLPISGQLYEQFGGTSIEGADSVSYY